jgi:hypothetical protein
MAEISDTELAELKKKAHAFDSEQGRLQKTQQELEAERAQRAEAEKRLAALQQTSTQLDPQAEQIFGVDGVTALQSMLAPVLGKLDTIGKRFDEQANADAQAKLERAYWGQLDEKLSGNNLQGFASRLRDGDLAAAWSKFLEARPSVKRGQAEADVETVSDAVYSFIQQNKELVAGGGYSPSAVSGSIPAVRCEYTDADYMRDKAVLKRQLDNLAITEAEFNKQTDALYGRWIAAQEKAEQAATAYGLV